MFCSNCGTKASGKFCFSCGHALTENLNPSPSTLDGLAALGDLHTNKDWHLSACYETVIRHTGVRETLTRLAGQSSKTLSGERFLELCDQVLSLPVSLGKIAKVVQPLYASWGIRTGKERDVLLAEPVGLMIARVLCSFAKNGQMFQHYQQYDTACRLEASLPSSIFAMQGTMKVTIGKVTAGEHEGRTRVWAVTEIPGQLMDWGKSTRCLNQLLVDLSTNFNLPEISPKQLASDLPTDAHRRSA